MELGNSQSKSTPSKPYDRAAEMVETMKAERVVWLAAMAENVGTEEPPPPIESMVLILGSAAWMVEVKFLIH